jgi:hypothetical protein
MTINPSTGVSEYWVTLRGQDFPDGAVEIRAIAYPKSAGKPRLLAGAYQASASAPPPQNGEYSMFAWANFGGTLDRDARYVSATGDDAAGDGSANNPYRTLSRAAQAIQAQYGSCDNAIIYCLPGEYDFEMKWGFTAAKANDRYITITTAPGILREQVVIEEARPKTARIRLNNVSIKTNDAGNFYTGFTDLRAVLWLDNCFVTTKNGRYGSTQKVLSTCTPYVTESVWHDAPDGPTDAVLVRNSTITRTPAPTRTSIRSSARAAASTTMSSTACGPPTSWPRASSSPRSPTARRSATRRSSTSSSTRTSRTSPRRSTATASIFCS